MKKKRSLGQNFLTDPHIADEIVRQARIERGGVVVEVGPGEGVLTERLLDACGRLIAIEIDPRLSHLLRKRFKSQPKFELVEEDALVYDYSKAGRRFQVVSNLPYYAAMPILKRLIHYKDHIADMTLMVQREVADRLVAVPGTRDYGSLTVFTQFNCDIERLMEVGKNHFNPPPKVDSTVIRLTPRTEPPVAVDDLKTFYRVVNAAFFHKRKMLKNNLKGLSRYFDFEMQAVEDLGIDPNRRGETLSLQEFAALANLMKAKPQ